MDNQYSKFEHSRIATHINEVLLVMVIVVVFRQHSLTANSL